ncbi:MAG: N-acetyl-gamma-glutamyl-phosphate reductase [Gammaproteobacteria bacterium]|nr:N-acetyl-gamma-glutamyl-phosphate reductase [Gammaproteobacteria bacterium]
MPKIFIDGESGTTGLQIAQQLAQSADFQVLSLPATDRKDVAHKLRIFEQVDAVLLCLPDAAAKETVALIDSMVGKKPRILDASTAHRTAESWVYGYPELNATQVQKIAQAERVSNPGCYATGAIALLYPLLSQGLLSPTTPLVISAVSGYSGGGKSMIADFESGQTAGFEIYSLGKTHKHIKEIMYISGLSVQPHFLPSVGNFLQGMLVQIPLNVAELPHRIMKDQIETALRHHYAQSKFVKVCSAPVDGRLNATEVVNTNSMHLYVCHIEGTHLLNLVACLDNLGKGASRAAMQNLHLMFELDYA